jgi:hypothetical protein
METSAIPTGAASSEPLKITSSIFFPRSVLIRCSPMTQRIASAMLLLPQPFGPTMPLIPGENSTTTFSMKDLKPVISSFLSLIFF